MFSKRKAQWRTGALIGLILAVFSLNPAYGQQQYPPMRTVSEAMENVEPVEQFSSSWETKKRPNMEPSETIDELKELHRQTDLIAEGEARCVILAPAGDRYEESVAALRSALEDLTGVDVPVVAADEDTVPENVLTDTDVITLGNMNTNPFIYRMYCRWLSLLDLKWPGPGGYALLSSHNPYGTGHNVIFVGGSDDEGVATATDRFVSILEDADTSDGLSVGWLHDIELGDIPQPPAVGEGASTWTTAPGGSQFGFNSISTNACLYYMTGRKEYLDQFKKLALSKPGDVAEELVEDYAYWTPSNPLVENYHYYSHLFPYVWDMIEESPLLSDDERVFITNKLIEQQDHYDPHDNFGTPNGSRHCTYQMMNIYTGSLYLAKYYPQKRWFQRLANMRKAFAAWYDSPTWGELDNVPWIPTSIEPVINFFLLDGTWKDFRAAGGVEVMMRPQKMLWNGHPGQQTINASQAQNLMYKAAYLLDDPSWVWLARQAPYNNDRFKIGQSWWPGDDLAPQPPTGIVDTITTYPLAPVYWQRMGKPFPQEQGYQFAVYRDSLGPDGDFLVMDGTWICPRLQYHVASPTTIRINGQELVDGYPLLLTRRNGLVESGKIPTGAALQQKLVSDDLAYMSSHLPHAWYSDWTRDLLHFRGQRTVIIDRVVPRDSGNIELESTWELAGSDAQMITSTPGSAVQTSQARLSCSSMANVSLESGRISEVLSADAREGETISIVNVLAPSDTEQPFVRSVEQNCHLLGEETCITVGAMDQDDVAVDAAVACLSPERIFAADAREIQIGGLSLTANQPVTCDWQLENGRLTLLAQDSAEVRISGVDINESDDTRLRVIDDADEYVVEIEPGTYTLITARTSSAADTVEQAVGSLADRPTLEPAPAQQATVQVPEWTPEWTTEAIGLASSVGLQSGDDGLKVWLAGREKPQVRGLTVETWVKPERLEENQALVSKWDIHAERSFMLLLSGGQPLIWTSPDGSYASLVTAAGTTDLDTDWHHLAATWDGENLRLFVDGVEEASQETQDIFSSGNPILLGQYAGGGYQYRGLLDDARVYDEALPPAVIREHASARGAARDTDDGPTPVWACSEPEDTDEGQLHNASWVQAGENHALELTQDRARVISDTASRGLLTVVDESGQVITRKETPAKVTAVCPVPDSMEANGAAFIAGLDNDVVMALDSDGETLWTEKAEVHQKFWYDGHWRAPWFTDPLRRHGIRDLMIDTLADGRAPELIVGRACTVELRGLDGELQGRVPIEWGDAATLQTVPYADGGRAVLAGKFGSVGHPGVSLIGPDRQLRTNGAYGGLPDGYHRITGWSAQGVLHLLSDDLENDGREELILVCCGSWNEIRVYDALTHEPKWAKAFGPGKKMTRFIPDVVTADLNGDGAREIALCGENGWVWVLSATGELIWARRPLQEATALAALNTAHGRYLVVGGASGNVVSLDSDGNRVAQADMQSPVLDVSWAENEAVIVVTEEGTVSMLSAGNLPAADR